MELLTSTHQALAKLKELIPGIEAEPALGIGAGGQQAVGHIIFSTYIYKIYFKYHNIYYILNIHI